jgi:hypothetical protein
MAPANYTERVILPVYNIFAGEKKQRYTPLYFIIIRDISPYCYTAALLRTYFNRSLIIQG